MPHHSWKIKKYSRHIYGNKDSTISEDLSNSGEQQSDIKAEEWRSYGKEGESILFSYTETNHLTVTQENVVMENISLIECGKRIEGFVRDGNLIIEYKTKAKQMNGFRCFRLEFDGSDSVEANANREDCVKRLVGLFPINFHNESNDLTQMEVEESNTDSEAVKEAYSSLDLNEEKMKEAVTLCLADPSFPTFVGQVDKILKEIKE